MSVWGVPVCESKLQPGQRQFCAILYTTAIDCVGMYIMHFASSHSTCTYCTMHVLRLGCACKCQ